MIEVLSSFTCTVNTFFVSVDIMDAYFTKSKQKLAAKDIHVIGMTSMLLASKMEEIIPFKVNTVVDKMAHNKISKKEIVECEVKILKALHYKLLKRPSLFVFIEGLIVKLNLHTIKHHKEVRKVVVYVSKMLLHELSIISKYSLKYLGASCLYICFKIIEQVNDKFRTKFYVEKLKVMLELNEQIFYNSSELLLDLAKNFEKRFPFARNLLKYDSFSLDKEEMK